MIDKSQPGLWIYPDGRERFTKNKAGSDLYYQRYCIAWRESKGICCLCGLSMHDDLATLEHLTAKGAGGGKHDDRQSNLGISHLHGNVAKGSMSLEQYLKLPLDVRVRNCK